MSHVRGAQPAVLGGHTVDEVMQCSTQLCEGPERDASGEREHGDRVLAQHGEEGWEGV
jgi:hypothetical protein